MSPDRPKIPAELKRRVLLEAGHRCAIPTCRHIEVDVHHIVPWSECKRHEYENLIALCPNCHRMAEDTKIDRKSLRIYKANLRYIHDKYSQLEMDILFELYKLEKGKTIDWPPFLLLLIKRILESEFVVFDQGDGGMFAGGMKIDPGWLTMTEKGRNFIDELGQRDYE